MFEIERKYVPDNWESGQSRRFYWIISRGVAVAILVTGFHLTLPLATDSLPLLGRYSDPTNRLQATAIFASSLLAFALIAVYRDIGETQTRQLQIQENQENLMELQYRPRIRTHRIRSGIEQNSIKVTMRNYGNGLAENLSLRCDIMLPSEDGSYPSDISTFSGDGTLEIHDSINDSEYTVEADASDLIRTEIDRSAVSIEYTGGHLPPDDGEVMFETTPFIRYQDEADGSIRGEPLVRFLKKIDNAGYTQLIIVFSVVFEDVNENKYVEYAFGTFFELDSENDDPPTMNDILSSSPPTYTPAMSEILTQVRSSKELYPT